MQNVDSKSLELAIRDESQVADIYYREALELCLNSELVLIERDFFQAFNVTRVPWSMCRKLAKARTLEAKGLLKAAQQNFRKAEIHRRRLQRLMSRHDALVEG